MTVLAALFRQEGWPPSPMVGSNVIKKGKEEREREREKERKREKE